MPGYVKLWRDYLDHDVFRDPILWQIFCWCQLNANYTASTYEGVSLSPGQFIMGTIRTANLLKIPEATLKRKLKILEDCQLIKRKATSRFTIVTVCNLEDSGDSQKQSDPAVDPPNEPSIDLPSDPPNGQQMIHQMATDIEGKKGRREEGDKEEIPPKPPKGRSRKAPANYPPEFEEFWSEYPRKEAKGIAFKAWVAACDRLAKRIQFELPDAQGRLLSITRSFANSPAGMPPPPGENDYRPHPSTWLNQDRFEDDRTGWQKPNGSSRNGPDMFRGLEEFAADAGLERIDRNHDESGILELDRDSYHVRGEGVDEGAA